jgi:hypothetical protein
MNLYGYFVTKGSGIEKNESEAVKNYKKSREYEYPYMG